MTDQTPMERGRELLRERVADLMLGVNVQEFELVENGAVVAQRLGRDVDVLDLGVLARVLLFLICSMHGLLSSKSTIVRGLLSRAGWNSASSFWSQVASRAASSNALSSASAEE